MKLIYISVMFLFLIFVNVNAADITCSFKPTSTGCSGSEKAFFRISDTDNAHIQLLNSTSSYSQTLCCSTTLGVINDICPGGTTIIKLQQETNSHAESPLLSNYGSRVCMKSDSGTISCELKSSCLGNEGCIGSLSGSSNAHISSCNSYNANICCKLTESSTSEAGGSARGGGLVCPIGEKEVDGYCVEIVFEEVVNETNETFVEIIEDLKEKYPEIIEKLEIAQRTLYNYKEGALILSLFLFVTSIPKNRFRSKFNIGSKARRRMELKISKREKWSPRLFLIPPLMILTFLRPLWDKLIELSSWLTFNIGFKLGTSSPEFFGTFIIITFIALINILIANRVIKFK